MLSRNKVGSSILTSKKVPTSFSKNITSAWSLAWSARHWMQTTIKMSTFSLNTDWKTTQLLREKAHLETRDKGEAENGKEDAYASQDLGHDKSDAKDDDHWQDMYTSQDKDQDMDTSLTKSESESKELEASLALDLCRLEPIWPSMDTRVDQDDDEEDLLQA
jgi:hypothetical protein